VENNPKWNGRTQGGALGQKGLFFLFRFINITLGYAILSFVVLFFMIINRSGYKAIWCYYREIHGFGLTKSFIKSYLTHFLFGQTLLDKFALFAGQKNIFKISISGKELFDEVVSSPKGAIIASSHIGNFEISGYLLHQTKKRINGIIYGGENHVIQEYRERILTKNNVYQIPVLDDMSHIFAINAALSRGEILAVQCDRVYTGNKTVTLDFLGQRASFPTGVYHIAAQFEVPVITLFVIKESNKHYHIFINRIDDHTSSNLTAKEKVDILVRNYVNQLEAIVIKYPTQWFNFYKFWD
jgi:predicted LPLAT superfamily acyltransferase